MPPYNIAYRPEDESFAEACTQEAQRIFAAVQDGYLLTSGVALPHVTVCQFDAPESALKEIWEEITALGSGRAEIVLASTYMGLGFGKHNGFVWTGLNVTRESSLVVRQKKIYELLGAKGLPRHTEADDKYWPHLTFARMRQEDAARVGAFWPSAVLSTKSRAFYLSLGLSDENGVYQKQIFPAK